MHVHYNVREACSLHNVYVFCSSLVGDGRLGYSGAAPYDAIHVGAAAETVPQAVSSL